MSDVVYRSEVRIKCIKGPVRNSVSPGRAGAVHFRPARRRCPSITTFAEPALQTLDCIVAAAPGRLAVSG